MLLKTCKWCGKEFDAKIIKDGVGLVYHIKYDSEIEAMKEVKESIGLLFGDKANISPPDSSDRFWERENYRDPLLEN